MDAEQLLHFIITIGKNLEKSRPELAEKLLLNFNNYDVNEMTTMFDGFNTLINKTSNSSSNTFDLNSKDLENLIQNNTFSS